MDVTSTRRGDPLVTSDEDLNLVKVGLVHFFKLEVEAGTTGLCQKPGAEFAAGIAAVLFRLVSLLEEEDAYGQAKEDDDSTDEIRQEKREALKDGVARE